MRIACRYLDEFLANVESASVYRSTIYVDKTSNPLNGTKHDATSFEIFLNVSCVLDFGEDDGQALLHYGESCGVDRKTFDGTMEGTSRQSDLYKKLREYCDQHELVLLPGLIDQ